MYLPQHTIIRNFSLKPNPGRRIEIQVSDKLITKDECRAIIEFYRKQANGGHITVHKKVADDSILNAINIFGDEEDNFYPWAVENFDGKGIAFNDFYFK